MKIEPFRFRESCDLVLLTGRKANSLKELVNGLKTLPDSVVYYHTHHFVTQISQLATELPNDFANWIRDVLLEKVIAERVAALDIIDYATISDLKDAIIRTIEDNMDVESGRKAPQGMEFHFMGVKTLSLILASKQGICRSFMKALKKCRVVQCIFTCTIKASFRKPYQ